MQMLVLNTSVNTLSSPSHAGCSFLSEQCKFPLGDVDLVRDRPLQNSWIHNFWGYISLLIYWAVIRIQRWTELEDIFKAAKEITRKPMRLVALLQHPWNTSCLFNNVKWCQWKWDAVPPSAIYLNHLGTVQNKWRLRRNSAGFVTASKGAWGK